MNFTYPYQRAANTTDIIIFAKKERKILLIQRKNEPFKNEWALPGGFMEIDETLEDCAIRELAEETGIFNIKINQFRTYSDIHRDPRHRTISTVFVGFIDSNYAFKIQAMDDAANIDWFELSSLPKLAFDHKKIIEDFDFFYH